MKILRATAATLALLGCAPIDVRSEVSVRPREGPTRIFAGEELVGREFVADYVQLGPRLLVEIRELRSCAQARHVPVLRVEEVHRSTRGFVIWDFVLGGFTGGFAALAFARPSLFAHRLVDGQGGEVVDQSGAYVVGGVFSAISASLLTAGIVDALRARDTTHYAEAFEVELGPAQPCGAGEAILLRERGVRLSVAGGVIEVEGQTDELGRVRFELPSWPGELPAHGRVPAMIEVAALEGGVEPRALQFALRVPFEGMIDAHTGVVDTREPARGVELDETPSHEDDP